MLSQTFRNGYFYLYFINLNLLLGLQNYTNFNSE